MPAIPKTICGFDWRLVPPHYYMLFASRAVSCEQESEKILQYEAGKWFLLADLVQSRERSFHAKAFATQFLNGGKNG